MSASLDPGESLHANAAAAAAGASPAPVLSILSPVFRNDPSPLFAALAREAQGLPVELVVVDDGSGQPALTSALTAAVDAFPAPAWLVTLHANRGRSGARNRLIAAARARHVLFLDSDMLPDSPDFLARWIALARDGDPAVAYGGYTTLQAPDVAEHRLARALAERMDCQDAAARAGRGASALATSNLLVRRDVLEVTPFDGGFQGWGWEDVDWAMRADAAGHQVRHADIPATHMGLDRAAVLLDKFARAGPNFAVMAARYPQMLGQGAGRAAALLARLPGLGVVTALSGAVARHEGLPLRARTLAARVWRAAHAARALRSAKG